MNIWDLVSIRVSAAPFLQLCTNLSWAELPRPTLLSRQRAPSCTPCALSCECPLVILRLRRFWLRLSCAMRRSRWLLDKPYFSSKQRRGSTLLIGWKMMAPTTWSTQTQRWDTLNMTFCQRHWNKAYKTAALSHTVTLGWMVVYHLVQSQHIICIVSDISWKTRKEDEDS